MVRQAQHRFPLAFVLPQQLAIRRGVFGQGRRIGFTKITQDEDVSDGIRGCPIKPVIDRPDCAFPSRGDRAHGIGGCVTKDRREEREKGEESSNHGTLKRARKVAPKYQQVK
jgi:hypothetical protein